MGWGIRWRRLRRLRSSAIGGGTGVPPVLGRRILTSAAKAALAVAPDRSTEVLRRPKAAPPKTETLRETAGRGP
jgi:hypothetical protein